ncbi:DDE-type integrase/transposase/recombinase [Azospirillum sp. Marseille-Q6669]
MDFQLSAKRDSAAARRFSRKALKQAHTVSPRVVTVDKNAAYPNAAKTMKKAGELWRFTKLRQSCWFLTFCGPFFSGVARLATSGPAWQVAGHEHVDQPVPLAANLTIPCLNMRKVEGHFRVATPAPRSPEEEIK